MSAMTSATPIILPPSLGPDVPAPVRIPEVEAQCLNHAATVRAADCWMLCLGLQGSNPPVTTGGCTADGFPPPGYRNDHKVAASSTSSTSPTTPITSPAATMRPSANTTPRQTTTTPSDGSVSRPENGGATNAADHEHEQGHAQHRHHRATVEQPGEARAGVALEPADEPQQLGRRLAGERRAELLPGQAARDPQLVTTDDHLQRDQAGEDLQHVGDAAGGDRERGGQHQHHEHDGEAALVEHVGEGADGDVILLAAGPRADRSTGRPTTRGRRPGRARSPGPT